MLTMFFDPYVFPNLDPVLLRIGPFAIHYYALAYVGGAFLGVYHAIALTKWQKKPMTRETFLHSFNWVLVSMILGGRLGYVLFYNFSYYWQHPIEIFFLWQGGMSFHGGMIGLAVGIFFYSRLRKLSFVHFMDIVVMVAPIGLFLGRLANFANGELWGRPTNGDWGVIFSHVDNLPRHPSQLYEAALEGILLYLLLLLAAKTTRVLTIGGLQGSLFIIFYGMMRFFVEFFRAPDAHLGLTALDLSRGQSLSLLQILAGIALFFALLFYDRSRRRRS